MSPKSMQYKANSIIFFKGDVSDRVFLLNSGKVTLNSIDIETGEEVHDLIKTGEFFGVKSALGRYPREETAQVLGDASVMAFTVPEFEQLAMKNTRIIMKMLKVFSKQLRHVHSQVQNLIGSRGAGQTGAGAVQHRGVLSKEQALLAGPLRLQALPDLLPFRAVFGRRHPEAAAGRGVPFQIRPGQGPGDRR